MIKLNDDYHIIPKPNKKFHVIHTPDAGNIGQWSLKCEKCNHMITDDMAERIRFIMAGHGK